MSATVERSCRAVSPARFVTPIAALLLALPATVGVGAPAAPQTPAVAPPVAAQLVGAWQGALALPGDQSLTIVVHIDTAGGALAATMDSPDQGAFQIPVGRVTFDGERLELTLPMIAARFEGRLEDGERIEGSWHQGGGSLSLTLRRADAGQLARPHRPQEPAGSPRYRVDEVTFENAAGLTLTGTLTIPEGRGPFPAVALISGSGPHDRDESMYNHRPFLVLADHLTRNGIAVLRWDDRGVGGSEGDFSTATSRDFAADAAAALEYLRGRREVISNAVGLAGHSEGGLVAGMVAARRDDVAFLVLLASPGLPGEEILYMQGRAIGQAMGAPEDAIQRNYNIQRETFDVLRTEPDPDRARAAVDDVLRRVFDEATPAERASLGIPAGAEEAWVQSQLAAVTSPWFRFFLSYDPRDDLRRIDPDVPVLAIIGDRDLQVPAAENLAAIREALAPRGNDLTAIMVPGLNHLFQTAGTGTPAEYALIEETFSPVAMNAIANWIRSVTGTLR